MPRPTTPTWERRVRWLAAHPDLLATFDGSRASREAVVSAMKRAGLFPATAQAYMVRVDRYVTEARKEAAMPKEPLSEGPRRMLVEIVNAMGQVFESRAEFEEVVGAVWDTTELQRDFEVKGFVAPYCVVRRKSDGAIGSLMFTHHPRYYFRFTEES